MKYISVKTSNALEQNKIKMQMYQHDTGPVFMIVHGDYCVRNNIISNRQ